MSCFDKTIAYLVAVKKGQEDLQIPIFDSIGAEIGFLVPLNKNHLEDDALIDTFARWRNQNLGGWLDQRPATIASTKNWLSNVIEIPNRLTFLIYYKDKPIGRCGFLDLSPEECEADGLIRGERGGGVGFMLAAQKACLNWQFEVLGIRSIWCKILSSNDLALNNACQLGYQTVPFDIRPVYQKIFPEGTLFSTEPPGELCNQFSLLYFRLFRSAFFNSAN